MPAMEYQHVPASPQEVVYPASDVSIEMATAAAVDAQQDTLTDYFKPETITATREAVHDSRQVAAYHATPAGIVATHSVLYEKVATGAEIDPFLAREYGEDLDTALWIHQQATRYGDRVLPRLAPGQELVACAALIMAVRGTQDAGEQRRLLDVFESRAKRFATA